MKKQDISFTLDVYQYDELSKEDRMLVDAAREATYRSYSPYSHFSVGAAALLENGEIVSGSNQENAASPSSLCAERTTLYYANSQYPDQPVVALAIAARNERGEFVEDPISPCGACRQVMLETQFRYQQPIRLILYGEKGIYITENAANLLPLSFVATAME